MLAPPGRLLRPLLFLILGGAAASWLIGFEQLVPTNASWFRGDPLQSYMAWFFLRRQDHLSFPLGYIKDIGFPIGLPVAYMDGNPFLATILWCFRAVLPDPFQYTGPYFVICCALQAFFGYRICRRLAGALGKGGARWWVEACAWEGALLFLVAPPFMFRARGHFTLASHWLVLAAIELFLSRSTLSGRRFLVAAILLAFVAGGMHPYLLAMVLMVLGAAGLDGVLESPPAPVTGPSAPGARGAVGFALWAAGAVLVLGAAVTSLVLFGFIVPGASLDQYAAEGYGYFSMNLLSPFDTRGYGYLPALPSGRGQFEGYSYLGLGMLMLGALSVLRRPSLLRLCVQRRVVLAGALVIASLLLALSSKAMLGEYVLYDVSLPNWLTMLVSSLRASGRLFVPGFYLVFIGILAAGALAFGRGYPIVLGLVVVVQICDLSPLARFSATRWEQARSPAFPSSAVWDALGRAHGRLVVVPPQECSDGAEFFGLDTYWMFDKPAAEQQMTTNTFYTARLTPTIRRYFCLEQPVAIVRDGMASDTAYVFGKDHPPFGVELGDHDCRPVDGVILCSKEEGRKGFEPAMLPPVAPVGEPVSFVAANGALGPRMLGLGWTDFDGSGRWSSAMAGLAFRLSDRQGAVTLRLKGVPLVGPGHPQRVRIEANGRAVGTWTLAQDAETELAVRLDPSFVQADGLVNLRLDFPDATSPHALNAASGDPRLLGFQLRSMQIDPSP